MTFKNSDWKIIWRVMLLLATLVLAAFLAVRQAWIYLVLLLPVIVYQVILFIRLQRTAYTELNQFVKSIQYRDFSRSFDVAGASTDLRPLRKGFNDIIEAFKLMSKEKETQYQYLQQILELVDTGIISYKVETGEVVWMNESLKKMLQLPYLKTIGSLKRRDEALYNDILSLKAGSSKISTAHLENGSFKLILAGTTFQTDGEKYNLAVFQNVAEALDVTEAKAWEKLLNVMTHEIMNSIAPISSLADTLKHRLKESMSHLNNETGSVDDLELGIDTIKRRSEGLLKFAETYRNLNKISAPSVKTVYVRDLFEDINSLMQPTFDQKNINLDIVLKDMGMMLEIDTSLIEQVLINLVVNSIEAIKDSPEPTITLSAYRDISKKPVIKVADNGTGIPPDVMEKIFIPFFSTKKSGSGIGLSLCKQIMMLHKGNIQVQSVENEGTAFLLQF
jgi:two-component system nitrogen regulation sensor histidine kinase NtrY